MSLTWVSFISNEDETLLVLYNLYINYGIWEWPVGNTEEEI